MGDALTRWMERGVADHERHPHQLVVDALPMREEAVVAHGLAVVGGHDEKGVVEAAAFGEAVHEAPDMVIDVAEPAVVEDAQPAIVVLGHAGRVVEDHGRVLVRPEEGLLGVARLEEKVREARLEGQRAVDLHQVHEGEEGPTVPGLVDPLEQARQRVLHAPRDLVHPPHGRHDLPCLLDDANRRDRGQAPVVLVGAEAPREPGVVGEPGVVAVAGRVVAVP